MAAPGGLLALLAGATAGVLVALALRELAGSAPQLAGWARSALRPLIRAGREGYEPSRGEGRRLALLGGACGAAAGWALAGGLVSLALAGGGAAAARWAAGVRRDRYRRRVEAALPEVAGAVADSLAAGRSLRAALSDLSGSLDGAAATELALLGAELDLGRPTAAASWELSARIGSPRIEAFVAALIAGRESGGDLAGLMRRIAAGAREHERALREARTATAQARFTGLLVAAMPGGAALFAELVEPGFFASLAGSPVSLALLAIAAGLQVVGFLAIRRLGRERE